MSRENPDTDEMLRLVRAREKTRRALTKAAAAAAEAQRDFDAADTALQEFERALKQRTLDAMNIPAESPPGAVPAAPTLPTPAPISRENLIFERRQLVAKNVALGAHPVQVAIRTERIKEIDRLLVDTEPLPNPMPGLMGEDL